MLGARAIRKAVQEAQLHTSRFSCKHGKDTAEACLRTIAALNPKSISHIWPCHNVDANSYCQEVWVGESALSLTIYVSSKDFIYDSKGGDIVKVELEEIVHHGGSPRQD